MSVYQSGRAQRDLKTFIRAEVSYEGETQLVVEQMPQNVVLTPKSWQGTFSKRSVSSETKHISQLSEDKPLTFLSNVPLLLASSTTWSPRALLATNRRFRTDKQGRLLMLLFTPRIMTLQGKTM